MGAFEKRLKNLAEQQLRDESRNPHRVYDPEDVEQIVDDKLESWAEKFVEWLKSEKE